MVRDLGIEVTTVNLKDFPMPLYDGDLEESEGLPEQANRFYDLMKQHDGFLISCPEYNSSITPLLKNTIDWASRPRIGDAPLAAFSGKIAALVATSPGALGGLRGLVHVTSILQNIGTMVVPGQVAVGKSPEALGEDGTIKDEFSRKMLDKLCSRFVSTLRGVHA
jgi:NAD(P)H-dependent FMN reductase